MKGDIEDLIQKLLFCISEPLNYEMDWRDNQEAKEVMKQKVLQNLQYALNSLKKRDLMQRLSQPEDFKIEPLDQLEFGRWLKNRQPRKHDAHLNKLMFRSKVRKKSLQFDEFFEIFYVSEMGRFRNAFFFILNGKKTQIWQN